ncbi:Alpha/Beta hydrolase protein [Xylaria castorea]|nr:Alpha/Beta hydrolase protein [Xylaria castorea]
MTSTNTFVIFPVVLIYLPPYYLQIIILHDTQLRRIPSSVNELQVVRKEEQPRDKHIYNYLGTDSPLPAIVLKSKPKPVISKSRRNIQFFHGGERVIGNVCAGLTAGSEFLSLETPGIATNLSTFNIDPDDFIVAGVSARAGLVAEALLVSRDRKVPKGQYAWNCVLGEEVGRGNVSYCIAPGRAEDFLGELFRDEDITYATKLWECGVQADLHIGSGGCHGFDIFLQTKVGA